MKIRNVKIKKTKKNDIKKSGYYAVLGNEELADLLRKGQSTTIRNGNELEDIIANQVSFNKVCSINFEDLLNKINTNPTENFYISKFSLKKEVLVDNGIELKGKKSISIDGLLYKDSVLYIIEYKDGDNLDTKKSQGEIESLSKISKLFTLFGIDNCPKLVLWRCDDVKNSSIKTTEHREYLTTGLDVSDILDISFTDIQEIRNRDQADNVLYFTEQVCKILNLKKIEE
jgi:hypothetical protein